MLTRRALWGTGVIVIGSVLASGCADNVQMSKMRAGPAAAGEVASMPENGGTADATGKAAPVARPGAPAMRMDAAKNVQDYDETVDKVVPIADTEPDRYLIKNATLTIENRDVRGVTAKVIAGATAIKGYVSGLHETVDALGARTVTFVVRVPFSHFDSFLRGFESEGKVLDREVTAEDVTEEFVDTQSKLRNLRSTEARLLNHLSRTGKLSDTLLVEKEVNRVREEIDRLTGRLKFLAHRVAYSTFNITVRETPHAQAISPPETFSVGKVVADSARSLVGFGQQVLVVGIWLMMWSVVWLPPVLLVSYFHWRKRGVASR